MFFAHLGDMNETVNFILQTDERAEGGDVVEVAVVEAADVEMGNFVRMGKEIPMPSKMADIMDREEYKGFQFGLVDIDITPFLGKTERLTITLPSRVVSAIDEHVRMYGLKSRSAFIADAAMAGISR